VWEPKEIGGSSLIFKSAAFDLCPRLLAPRRRREEGDEEEGRDEVAANYRINIHFCKIN